MGHEDGWHGEHEALHQHVWAWAPTQAHIHCHGHVQSLSSSLSSSPSKSCHWAHRQLHRRLHRSSTSHHPLSRSAAHAHSHVPALAVETAGWTGLGQPRWHRRGCIDSVPRLGDGDEPSDWDQREEREGDLSCWHGTTSWCAGGSAARVEHRCLQWYAWWPLRSVERFLSVFETGSERRSGTTTGSSEMRRRIPILIDSASSMGSVEVVVRVSPRWAPPSVNV